MLKFLSNRLGGILDFLEYSIEDSIDFVKRHVPFIGHKSAVEIDEHRLMRRCMSLAGLLLKYENRAFYDLQAIITGLGFVISRVNHTGIGDIANESNEYEYIFPGTDLHVVIVQIEWGVWCPGSRWPQINFYMYRGDITKGPYKELQNLVYEFTNENYYIARYCPFKIKSLIEKELGQ